MADYPDAHPAGVNLPQDAADAAKTSVGPPAQARGPQTTPVGWGAQAQSETAFADGSSPIRLVIADTEPIFRVGMRKIFAIEDDIRVVAQTETLEQTEEAVQKFHPDVLLMEAAMAPDPAECVFRLLKASPGLRIVLIVSHLGEDETLELVRRGAWGVVPRSIPPDLLVKCVHKVHAGETWLDKRAVNLVIEAYRMQALKLTSPRPKTRLNNRELAIIGGVAQGLRNREIAVEVGTTEQVVKNYLRKIYDKLGVSDRLELALYCMHHRLLAPAQKSPESVPAARSDDGDSLDTFAVPEPAASASE